MVANLTQILNFKANFHQEFELLSKNKILQIVLCINVSIIKKKLTITLDKHCCSFILMIN